MPEPFAIRLATPEDADGCLEIYQPIVAETPVSFETSLPTTASFAERIAETTRVHPWLVAETEGSIAGYAYATGHRAREAYQWCAEVSVYVGPRFQRLGVARRLYRALLDVLGKQGFYNAYAGIALPNDASVAFHESMGFEPVGVYRSVGYKLGRWHDVGWWARRLNAEKGTPTPPLPLPACRDLVIAMLREL